MAEQWQWDEEDNPRHLGCGGEMTFFETLTGEEVGMCLTCCSTDFDPDRPVPIDG
jgi:hypothetical protein